MRFEVRKGVTRWVLIFDTFVVKIPRATNMLHFLGGCYANWSERNYCKVFKGDDRLKLVALSYFCSWFGLCQIQAKCEPISPELKFDKAKFEALCGQDSKNENFGIYKGNIVCCDYP